MKPGAATRRWLLGGVFFAALVALGPVSLGDEVDDLVKAELDRQKVPGAAVVVLKAGKVIKVGAYGVAGVAPAVPVVPETIFRLSSMSKPFTATGIMMLVEEGKMSLDDSVGRYLAGCPEAWRKLTVRHLLSHTSGLRDFINEPTLNLKEEATDEQIMASVAGRSLKFEPGEAHSYSNTNYHLLAMIIRKVTGQWYGDFLARRIFQPLGMTHTSVSRDRKTGVQGYTLNKGRVLPSGADTNLALSILSYGGGGIQSTVLDLAKWEAALYTGQLLKRSTLEQMWEPTKLNNGTTHLYGLGWNTGEIAKHRRVSHAGIWTGFASQMDRFVDDEVTVMVLTNLAESDPARISRAIAGTFIPAVAVRVYKPIADQEPAVTARFVDVLRRTSEGGLRAEEFTEPVWAYLAPRIDQVSRDFGSFGAIQNLTLVERTEKGGERSYRYRARFSRLTMIFHFVLTKEGRIGVMMPEEINP